MRPLRSDERNWTWWNYATIWMGIVHNIVAWQVAANLIAIGMSFWQALACVSSAYLIAFIAILANSVLGSKYGLSFPVLIRAAFGRHGAQIPVVLRAFVAIFWFAVHIYIGSKAIAAVLSSAIPDYSKLQQYHLLGMNADVLLAFILCCRRTGLRRRAGPGLRPVPRCCRRRRWRGCVRVRRGRPR